MKKFLKWVAIVFVGLIVLGAIIDATKSPEQKAADQAAREQEKAAKAQAQAEQVKQELANLVTVTASELASAYDNNTVAADQQFKGKKFKVSGTVSDINTDFMGAPYLVLRSSGNPFMQPQFGFEKEAAAQLAKISKGSKVVMVCTGKGDVAKTPMAGNCSLL